MKILITNNLIVTESKIPCVPKPKSLSSPFIIGIIGFTGGGFGFCKYGVTIIFLRLDSLPVAIY